VRALLFVIVVSLLVAVPPQNTCAIDATQRLVTIQANNTRLADVLSILSEKSGLNIVAAADVEDKMVSLNLRETPVEEALNLIVRAAGLGYEKVGNSVLVAESSTLEQETGLSTYVIPLEFADAFELVPVVEKMVTNVAADPGGNRLVVVATPGLIEQIRSVIKELDVAPVQIMLETEVIEVSTNDLMELGIDWSKITKQSVILTEGPHEASSTDAIPSEMGFVSGHLDPGNIYHQAEALEVALDFLETTGKARVLTRAKLATLNNRKAEIHIGDVIPYTVTGLTAGGTYEVRVEKSEVGVQVNVTPRAAGDGHITVLVEPNVSTIVGWKGANEDIPWTKERRATTQVRVLDGQTFMIAGLLSEDETIGVTKVPLLGDIPFLGYLFQHQKKEFKNSDLIIKITPTIMP
jgi:type II secretory pathway component GspD/PulD (secretin)